MDQALRRHAEGRLADAERLYRRIVQADPRHSSAWYGLGVIALQAGKHNTAVDRLAKALAITPDHIEANIVLGNALGALGKLDEAIACYRKALAMAPRYAEVHNNLGNALGELGNLDEEVASYRKALAIKPDYAEAHNNLGVALKEQGKLDEAVASHRHALALKPGYAEAHINLGVALKELGKLDEAVASYRKALTFTPDDAEAHSNLGNALRDLGSLDEAISCHRKALAIAPDYAEAHSNLGDVLQDQGKLDEAVDCYHKALAIAPDYAKAHNNLGNALQGQGKLDEAVASYRRTLAILPDYAEAHRHLAISRKFSEYHNDIKAMEDTYALPGLSDRKRMHLAFGLGKSFEDLRLYEKAFGFFITGNALKRGTYAYSIDSVENNLERLKDLFDKDFFSKNQAAGSPDESPIFILGMPRSGTTLVEQILASHAKVHGAGELVYLRRIVASLFAGIDDSRFIESLDQAGIGEFSRAGGEYIRMIREHAEAAAFITDKMPLNFWFIGMIKLMLPKAKIIHCRRDPRDTCLSIFKNYFSADGNLYAYDLGELGRYHNLYSDLMDHWHGVLPGFIYDVHYEELVADQEGESRAMLAHCGLEWDAACLDFHRTDRAVLTASAAQVRRPIYQESVQSWKRYEDQLAPLFEALGPG